MSASSLLDLDNELNRNDESRNDVDIEDDDVPAIKHNRDRTEQAHYLVTGHNAQHNKVPESLTGQIQTQNNPIPQQFTQPQNMTTHF